MGFCSLFFRSIIILGISFIVYFEVNKYNSKPRFEKQQQIEFTKNMDNLYPNGTITAEGWARHPIWEYKREYIKALPVFIKEWDYYISYIEEKNLWVAATLSDLGYANMTSISVIDCNLGNYSTIEEISPFPLGKVGLLSNSLKEQKNIYQSNNIQLNFEYKGNDRRKIDIGSPNLILPNGEKGISLSFELYQPGFMESINIQTTWQHDRSLFYLNEKVNGMMPVRGFYKLGDRYTQIFGGKKIFTTLDWGRGVWAYTGTWYWSSGTGIINGRKIGFNFGYGFTDRSPATENCLFMEDKIEKLNIVNFELPVEEKNYGNKNYPWYVKSDDGRVDLKMIPDVDRSSYKNYGLIKTNQHQVFGTFEGNIILEDGRKFEIKNLHGFIEKVYNRW